MYASRWGHTATVELLLKHGADINDKDKYGRTALDFARKEEIKQLLRQHGAKYGRELR